MTKGTLVETIAANGTNGANNFEPGVRVVARRKSLDADRVFDFIVFWILTAIFLIVAHLLYFVIFSSISTPTEVAMSRVLWYPVGINLDGYHAILEESSVVGGFINSIFYTVLGTSINLAVTVPAAYALSRPDFYGKKAITIFSIVTMFISGGLNLAGGWFGLPVSDDCFTMENGQVAFGATRPEYREGVRVLSRMYAEGLIDPEVFTQDGDMWGAKIRNNIVGTMMAYGPGDFLPGQSMAPITAEE